MRHRLPRRLRSARSWMALGLDSGVTAALAVVPTVLLGADHSVQAPPGTRPEQRSDKALNVLVIGSDHRAGVRSARSDTMVLLRWGCGSAAVRTSAAGP